MLLTITTTHYPATDLGHLLHKHPDRAQQLSVAGGVAHIFYPEASEDRCTAALLVDIDPVGLVRGRHSSSSGPLAQYINDRTAAAGSQLAVALKAAFATALRGRCDSRPELAASPIPLEIRIPSLAMRADAGRVESLFVPLGWEVELHQHPYDKSFPEWGAAPYADVRLTGTLRLADALSHLYVLLPVLDGGQHYWVTQTDVEKLLRAGASWLRDHPEQEFITGVYLAWAKPLVDTATEQLARVTRIADESVSADALTPRAMPTDPGTIPLTVQRRRVVADSLRRAGARRIVDIGCGDGALLEELHYDPGFTDLLGVDVSPYALRQAARRLHLDDSPHRATQRVQLRQSSLVYTDPSLRGFDAAVLMEVIEHIDPERLPAAAESVFGVARPRSVIVTTPNADYNPLFPTLPAGQFRHPDHRFEWTRLQFREWAQHTAEAYGYSPSFLGIGEEDPHRGAPTQMAFFTVRGDT